MITVYWPDRKEPEAFINNGVRDSVAVPAWDTHGNKVGKTPNFPALRDKLLPALDLASSALLDDLQARGLLDQTLVAWTGEFGRSPLFSQRGTGGREHWSSCMSMLVAGGGLAHGKVIASTDARGGEVKEACVTPADVGATVYRHLGIDLAGQWTDAQGRPQSIVTGGGRPIPELG